MADTVRDIKDRLSILDVVLPYVKLSKAGKSWKGLSPFTKEKTASFFVSPDRGTYYCFSTNQGGDIFTFIQKVEGVDFKGALSILAAKAGVDIRPVSKEDKDEKEVVYEILSFAELFFHNELLQSTEARDYVQKRGIDISTVEGWRIGYAKDEWRYFMEAAEKKGFSKETLLLAGLIKEADGKPGTFYDRFRGRVLFPLRDTSGRTIAFSGRALKSDSAIAKYLNSPETVVFKKSDVLYGLDKARESIRTRGYVIVVEGQIDLVLCHQAGFTNTVALSGTAFTETQLRLLERLTKNLLLALDQDRAGLASMRAIASQAYMKGMDVKIVPLTKGSDPADVISSSKDVFVQAVRESLHAIDFFSTRLLLDAEDRHTLLKRIETELLPVVGAIRSPLMRNHALEKVSSTLGIPISVLLEALPRVPTTVVQSPVLAKNERQTFSPLHTLAALVKTFPESDGAGAVVELSTQVGILLPEEIEETALFDVERLYEQPPNNEEGRALARAILAEHIKTIFSEVAHDIRRAEALSDHVRLEELSQKTLELTRALGVLSHHHQ